MENYDYIEDILQNPGLSHIGTIIFSYLDLQSLLNCQKVSKNWKHFIEKNKVLSNLKVKISNLIEQLEHEKLKRERAEKLERERATFNNAVSIYRHSQNCTNANCDLYHCQRIKGGCTIIIEYIMSNAPSIHNM